MPSSTLKIENTRETRTPNTPEFHLCLSFSPSPFTSTFRGLIMIARKVKLNEGRRENPSPLKKGSLDNKGALCADNHLLIKLVKTVNKSKSLTALPLAN